jgi:hypothetical protein
MSAGLFKKARISVPICLFLVLVVVFSFLIMPGISTGDGVINIVTMPATDIDIASAQLNARVEAVVDKFSGNHVYALPPFGFVWGPNHGGPYPNTTPAQVVGATTFSSVITGLTPFTTYYFKAYVPPISMVPQNNAVFADDTLASVTIYGLELNFTTLGQNITGGTVATGDAGMAIGTPAEVHFNFINVQPTIASAGQPVTVVANVVNRGSLEGGYTANLQINGRIEQTTMGTVAGNTFVPVQFTVVKDTPGTYDIDIGGQTTSFTVIASEDTSSSALSQSQIIVIILVILGIAVVGLFIAVIMRRRSSY